MTELRKVQLIGIYRDHKAVVIFSRRGKTWELAIAIGKKRWRSFTLDSRLKPCWTVAMDFMVKMFPTKQKPSRNREQVKPELKLYA